MELAFEACRLLSLVAFLGYGLLCVSGRTMVDEFERFGLARFRVLTGCLEILGALGLAGSYAFPWLVQLSAGGLCLLMFLGVLTRLRLRDPWYEVAPAFVLMLVNGFLVAVAISGP